MKNKLKLLTGIFLLTISLHSCSKETQETTDDAKALEKELAQDHNGVLKLESATYIFQKTGETTKFLEDRRDFNFKFVNKISYQTTGTNKHAIEGLTITNPETGEHMIFSNFEELKNGFLSFDVALSSGQTLSSVSYKPGNETASTNKWHGEPLLPEPSNLIGAMIEVSQQELVNDCRGAMEVCAATNGVPTVALNNGKGWFTGIESCSLECDN
jgi:hypothetical protein